MAFGKTKKSLIYKKKGRAAYFRIEKKKGKPG